MNDLKNIIESLLFIADGPLSIEGLKSVLTDAGSQEIKAALNQLVAEHQRRAGGFVLHEVAGGYQFRTRPEYKEYIQLLHQPAPARLSKAALETLAIVAYHQPVLRSEVENIRGVNSGNTLRFLLEKKLVRVLGRREVPGRPLVYGTTKQFLETFDLRDLKDLPTPGEIEPRSESDPRSAPAADSADLPLGDPNSGEGKNNA